jgi:hypothetical protein
MRHILERTHSRENTFYRDHRTHSIENTFLALHETHSTENTFYREHIHIENTFLAPGYMLERENPSLDAALPRAGARTKPPLLYNTHIHTHTSQGQQQQ